MVQNEVEFEFWMKLVDKRVGQLAGCSVHDLDDCCFRDWYEDGMTPLRAAKKALKNAGSDE